VCNLGVASMTLPSGVHVQLRPRRKNSTLARISESIRSCAASTASRQRYIKRAHQIHFFEVIECARRLAIQIRSRGARLSSGIESCCAAASNQELSLKLILRLPTLRLAPLGFLDDARRLFLSLPRSTPTTTSTNPALFTAALRAIGTRARLGVNQICGALSPKHSGWCLGWYGRSVVGCTL
jgi:hypothetical protein